MEDYRASINGCDLILKERIRQIKDEGWDSVHDDEHKNEELAQVAACYAISPLSRRWNAGFITPRLWPATWKAVWWKPTPENRIKELSKAGALIAAEIDRLCRIESKIGIVTSRTAVIDSTRPSLGVKPKKLHDEQRFEELQSAILRHALENRSIPLYWITEFKALKVTLNIKL